MLVNELEMVYKHISPIKVKKTTTFTKKLSKKTNNFTMEKGIKKDIKNQ